MAEARAFGLAELLLDSCAQEVRWWRGSVVGTPGVTERDLVATTPARAGELTFYHPAMQETLLRAAADAGAEVRRGARAVGVAPGGTPTVQFQASGGAVESAAARFIVAADGRDSPARRWAGFAVNRDPERQVIASTILAGMRLPGDAVHMASHREMGRFALFFPLRDGRHRVYYVYRRTGPPPPLSGSRHLGDFVAACTDAGAEPGWFTGARLVGPLAAFAGAARWVDQPYRAGVALVGDAAAASDPSWGCGMGLALHDVRALRDLLLAGDDWDAAGRAYAAEHDRFYGALRRLERWRAQFLAIGPADDAWRARVLYRLAAEPERAPDLAGRGPDGPSDEATLRYFS